ncbi:DctP family TRAP transporter solute-binding subunit [Ornithinicoccus halotolerans]|uniref:DctP family TRAP transporter solute-binding subunit n=1 Tax=Ornithinicoccus halotolerans TaxID=1748220 RepID=UPI0012951F94|nr:DctP family TRAP transporter solute-binding subunit [Ornithinicoccus halotolerans]
MATRATYRRTIAVAFAGSLTLTACGGGGEGEGGNPEVEFRAAHAQTPEHPYQTCGLEHMQQVFEDNPEANLSMEIFPSAQLGSNEENLEEIQAGTLDMSVPGLGSLTVFDEQIGALETAFSVESQEELQELVDGEVGEELLVPLRESHNVRVLGPLWALGSRHITANKVVESPEDLAGVPMRSQQTAASRATTEALGGTPTPVDFSELYLALSQGVVQAQENPVVQIDTANLHEVQDYMMMTGHIVNVSIVAMAESSYQELTDEQQQVLDEAASSAAAEVDQCIADAEEEIMQRWEDEGAIEVIPQDQLDMEAFRQNAKEVYTGEGSEYADTWGDLYLQLTEGEE